MIDNILFHILFLGQILLLSHYFPAEIYRRMRYVSNNFPEQEYPKLYPQPQENYIKGHKKFRTINNVIVGIGLVILGMVIHYDFSNRESISAGIPGAYFMLQILPYAILELSSFSYFKQMRSANHSQVKTTSLDPRGLFDFVSPVLVSIAAALLVIYLVVVLFYYEFDINFENGSIVNIVTILLSNLFLAGIVYWNLYSKKLNPHQSSEDRMREIKLTIESLTYISIAASAFLITEETSRQFGLDELRPVMMVLYMLLIGYISMGLRLSKVKMEDINFDVYKADAK